MISKVYFPLYFVCIYRVVCNFDAALSFTFAWAISELGLNVLYPFHFELTLSELSEFRPFRPFPPFPSFFFSLPSAGHPVSRVLSIRFVQLFHLLRRFLGVALIPSSLDSDLASSPPQTASNASSVELTVELHHSHHLG